MSALVKSKSRPLIEPQSRQAVMDVNVAPPNQGVFQFTSADRPLSLMSCSVLRLLHASRRYGRAIGATPSSGDKALTISPVRPRVVVTPAQQFSSRLVKSAIK